MMGGFIGAMTVYVNYYEQIDLFEGGTRTVPGSAESLNPTAGIFSTVSSSAFHSFGSS